MTPNPDLGSEFPRLRLETMDPRTLRPNPLNYRRHGVVQRRAFAELVNEIGLVQAPLYNERTGRLLDGHMRVQEYVERNEPEMPVLVVDLPEDKEHLAVLMMDRIGALASVDRRAEAELAALVAPRGKMLAKLVGEIGVEGLPVAASDQKDDPHGVGLVPGEAYNYVVLLFRTEIDWFRALDHFRVERVRDPFHTNVLGLGRVIDGAEYLARLGVGEGVE